MESGERTEKATPKKRKDARDRGQVRKSAEIVTAVMMLATFAALSIFGNSMWDGMVKLLKGALQGQLFPSGVPADTGIAVSEVQPLFMQVTWEYALIALPILGVAFITAAAANLAQVGLLFSTKALSPKMERINPLKGLKRMFSLQTLVELMKSIAKVIVIGFIAYSKYMSYIESFSAMPGIPLFNSLGETAAMVLDTGFTIAFALLVIAALDYVYQWFKFEKDLRMTKYEVKLEYKQQEGDPQIKGRIKQKQRQMATMRMMQSVPTADVVITNPTHYAVALKYDEKLAAAPVVVAKGADYTARRIKELAAESNVEIVENVDVARGLYAMCEVGSEVPLELYQAVAEILAFVYRKKHKI